MAKLPRLESVTGPPLRVTTLPQDGQTPTLQSAGSVRVIIGPPPRPQPAITADDELAFTVTVVEEDAFSLPPLPWPQVYRGPVLGTDEDQAGLLGGLRVDELYHWTAQYLPLPFRPTVIFDHSDEAHAGLLGGLRVEEDPWDQPRVWPLPTSRLVYQDAGDDRNATAFYLDEEFWDVPGMRAYRTVFETRPLLAIGDDGDWQPEVAAPAGADMVWRPIWVPYRRTC